MTVWSVIARDGIVRDESFLTVARFCFAGCDQFLAGVPVSGRAVLGSREKLTFAGDLLNVWRESASSDRCPGTKR